MYKCVNRIKNDKGQITWYILHDENDACLTLSAGDVKYAIKHKQIQVENLTLTKNNRLIEKRVKQEEPKAPINKDLEEEKIKKLIASYNLMNKAIKVPTIVEGIYCYLIDKTPFSHILYIPENVKILNGKTRIFTDCIKELEGKLRVVGGRGLEDISDMFSSCKIRYIDFTLFHTENVKTMAGMFHRSNVERLDLHSFNTKNVEDMSSMFEECMANTIDLSSFNTPKLTEVASMFRYCHAYILDVSTLNTEKVEYYGYMFENCFARKIIFGNFNTKNAKTFNAMFRCCLSETLDLTSFRTEKVVNMDSMFAESKAETIKLKSFNTESVLSMNSMFRRAAVKYLDLSSFRIRKECAIEGMLRGVSARKIKTNRQTLEYYVGSDLIYQDIIDDLMIK